MRSLKNFPDHLKVIVLLAVIGAAIFTVCPDIFTKTVDEFVTLQHSCDRHAAIPWLRCDIDFRSPSQHLLTAAC